MSNKPEKTGFEPEVVILYCQHCVSRDGNARVQLRPTSGFSAGQKMMPCSSKIEVAHLLKILEQGADGIEVVTCSKGKCRLLVGNLRAEKRIEYTRRLLDEIHMGANRLGLSRGSGLSAEELMSLARGRAEAVRPLGPNPMKKANGL